MPKESTLQLKIQRAFEARGAWVVKIHGGPFQPAAIDLLACYKGHFIGIETKVPGGNATPRQVHTLVEIGKAGGHAHVVRTLAEGLAILEEIDRGYGK